MKGSTLCMLCSDDEEVGNPMVAGFQDELDSDDEAELSKASAKPTLSTIPSQDVDLSSDDDEDKDKNDGIPIQPVIMPDEDVDLDADSVTPNTKKPTTQRTLLNANQTSGNQVNLESVTKDTSKKESDRKSSSSMASANRQENNESSEDDDDEAPAVTVLADNDISDDDTTTSGKPVDSGLATDTTQVTYNHLIYSQPRFLIRPSLMSHTPGHSQLTVNIKCPS